MAISVYPDPGNIWEGSSLTRGIFSSKHDRAIRRFLVEGMTSTDTVNDAIQEVVDREGDHHPEVLPPFPSLPAQTGTGQRWGPEHSFVTLQYWRNPATVVPHQPGMALPKMRSGYMSTDWVRIASDQNGNKRFDSDGLPDGDIAGFSSSFGNPDAYDPESRTKGKLKNYKLLLPVMHLFVPTVLPYNPWAAYTAYQNKVNRDTINFAGVLIPPRRCRFDSLDIDWEFNQATNGLLWLIQYVFTFCPNGFWKQEAYFGDQVGGAFPSVPDFPSEFPQWRTQKTLLHDEIKFPNFAVG